jgi:hypothetical protein
MDMQLVPGKVFGVTMYNIHMCSYNCWCMDCTPSTHADMGVDMGMVRGCTSWWPCMGVMSLFLSLSFSRFLSLSLSVAVAGCSRVHVHCN